MTLALPFDKHEGRDGVTHIRSIPAGNEGNELARHESAALQSPPTRYGNPCVMIVADNEHMGNVLLLPACHELLTNAYTELMTMSPNDLVRSTAAGDASTRRA